MADEQQARDEAGDEAREERQLALPAWVPAAIGLTLVALAAMAVYTGFRTRVKPPERATEVGAPFTEVDGLYPEDSGGPPGAPEPGASRVRPGSEVPAPGPSDDEKVEASRVGIAASRGIVFDVQPSDAVIYVNDVEVGSARQFAAAEDAYEFAEEGAFLVRIAAAGHEEFEVVVLADRDAAKEIAEVSVQLEPAR